MTVGGQRWMAAPARQQSNGDALMEPAGNTPVATESQGTADRIERFIHDLFAAWNAHDLDRIVAFYAPGYEGADVSERAPQRGPAGIRATLDRYFGAFPDIQFSADEVLVQGNRAAVVWTARGTHRGPVMGIPPTGHQIAVAGVSRLVIEDGRVVSARYIWDVAGLLRAIKLLPDL